MVFTYDSLELFSDQDLADKVTHHRRVPYSRCAERVHVHAEAITTLIPPTAAGNYRWCLCWLFKRIHAFRRAKVDDAMCREMWAEGHGCSVAEGKWPWK